MRFIKVEQKIMLYGKFTLIVQVQRNKRQCTVGQPQADTIFYFIIYFCPGTITHAESINSDLQRGLDRRLRHIQH